MEKGGWLQWKGGGWRSWRRVGEMLKRRKEGLKGVFGARTRWWRRYHPIQSNPILPLERLYLLVHRLFEEIREKHCRQIALSKGRNDHNDCLPSVLRTTAHSQGGAHCSAGGDTTQHALGIIRSRSRDERRWDDLRIKEEEWEGDIKNRGWGGVKGRRFYKASEWAIGNVSHSPLSLPATWRSR